MMVLLEDIVQVLELPHDDRRFTLGIDLVHGRFVGIALVHRELFGNTACLQTLSKNRRAAALSRLTVSRKSIVLRPAARNCNQAYVRLNAISSRTWQQPYKHILSCYHC